MSIFRLSICVAALLWLLQPAVAQQSRVALVIGNARYAEAPLKNPVNDARAMAAALRARGFEVIIRENATKQQMEAAVADFGEKLNENATGLFFYAGHGIQVQGRNYLMPVDARVVSEQRVRLEALDVDAVLDQMQAARSKVSMVILDACRNNPFERRFRSTGGGLAQLNAPEGTLIAYATAPGKVAADGEGGNGLYTQEFLKALATPGLKVEDVFKQVRINVSRASDGQQIPWEASSLTGDFYFVPPVAAAPPPTLDQAFWNAVKDSNTPASLQAYLDTFPAGLFAAQARAQMTSLSGPAPAAAPARPAPPAAVAAPPPAPKPAQQAALPPPGAGPSGGSFDGLYTSASNDPRGFATSTIEIKNGAISGFATSQAAGGVCRASGSINPATGQVQHFEMTCPLSSTTYAGRFTDSDTQLTGRSTLAGEYKTLWKKMRSFGFATFNGRYVTTVKGLDSEPITLTIDVVSNRINGFATGAAMSGLCPISGAVDETGKLERLEMLCRWSSTGFFGSFVPVDGSHRLETEARSSRTGNSTTIWTKVATPPSLALDGRYTGTISSRFGVINVTLDIAGTTVTGFAGGATAAMCRAAGTLDTTGGVERLELTCPNGSWTFSGKFTPNGGDTIAHSVTAGTSTIAWKKEGS